MVTTEIDAYNSFSITFRPNSALTASNKQKIVMLLTIIPLIVGLGFAILGAWLILPFVGLEIIALAYAFYYINRHEDDFESITIEGDSLVVQRRLSGKLSQQIINPYWAKVIQHELPNGELHLYLQSHGKEIEVGRYLTRNQREALAMQLQNRTGTFNKS